VNEIIKNKKFIFFDIGYTLERPVSGDWFFTNKFNELTKNKLVNKTKEEIDNAKIKALMENETHHKCLTLDQEIKDFITFYSIINDELDLKLTENEIKELSIDRATNMDNYAIYEDTVDVLKELSKHFKLGIISDTWPSIIDQLKHFGIEHYFSSFTYSYELGVFKPSELMFLDALKKSGCKAEETVFIDDILKNLKGANKAGITPILIAINKESDVETEYTKIYSLKELID